jgi:hypothetical protein
MTLINKFVYVYRLGLLALMLLYFYSCKQDNIVYYKNFPQENFLVGDVINIDDSIIHEYPLLTIMENKLIILDFATDEYYYHVYDTIDYSYKYSFGKRGRGVGELMYTGSLYHNNGILYVDNGLKRSEILAYKIGDDCAEIIDTIKLPNEEEICIIRFVVESNKAIWGLPVSGKEERRLYKIGNNRDILDSLFYIPKNPEWSLSNPTYTWDSHIAFNHNNSKLVLATCGGERLDILNTQNGDSLTIIGPGGNPIPDIKNDNIHLDYKVIGFRSLQVTDNHIYALYSGQYYKDIIWSDAEEIYSMNVYTLDGVPIIKYHFDKPIISIYVDEENRTMYATAVTGEEEESIVKYRF